jgi:hypothetical protein
MCNLWGFSAVQADTVLRLAKGLNTPAPEVQAAVNVLVNSGSPRTGMEQRLKLYKFTSSEVDTYVDAAYPT